jgi:molybdopterin converting factor small subunit
MICVELFGVPRIRAGRARVRLEAQTVGEALVSLGRACPGLAGSVLNGEGVHPAYKLNINGEHFVTDPGTRLSDGDALLLLSADVGG